jgi:aspartyl-tRNA(Asn)/glutamyl-tRNA(Gln) amidotransferase subunit A
MERPAPSRTTEARRDLLFRERIARHPELNAFISLSLEQGSGDIVAVKDVIDVAGMVTTGGGVLLPRRAARRDARVIEAIRQAGCAVVGKTNLHEWAFGPTSVNPHYGAVRNPHARDRVAGGSSGGSAVAVAEWMCDWAIGTDTGGSIRIPASLCGVVGLKPTLGRIGTAGVTPLSTSLDTIGPLARDVATAARALDLMCGVHGVQGPAPLQRPKLAMPEGWIGDLDAQTRTAWDAVSAGLPAVPFPDRQRVAAPGRTIMYHEAAVFHRAWMRDSPDRYGADVRSYLEEGARISAGAYESAVDEAKRVRIEVEDALTGVDALMLPTTACVAPPLDVDDAREPLTRFTRPFNTTGHPAISLPAPAAGLPVGIQLIGRLGHERQLIRVALGLEQAWNGHGDKEDDATACG